MLRRILLTFVTIVLALSCVGVLFGMWGYYYLVRDLPKLSRIEDYKPPAVTRVLASDGSIIAEFFSEKRYPVKMQDVPDIIRKAFLAAEDSPRGGEEHAERKCEAGCLNDYSAGS